MRDDGIGFDTATTTPRLGLTRAVRGSLAQVGGAAEVDSVVGGGTSVELTWQEPAAARRDALVQAIPQVMAAAMPPLTVPVAVWAGVSLAASWTAYGNPWLALLGFALLLGLDAVLLLRRPPDWPVTILACAVAATVYFLVQAAAVGGAPTLDPWGFWPSPALLGALIAVAMSGPRWGWLLVLATWVAFQGDVLELIRPGGVLLIAASFASRVVHRLTVSYDTAVTATLEAETRTRASREAQRRRNARYSALTTTVLPLLDDLAAGRLDPHDARVQARCREEERFARTLVRLDPDAGDVPALMVRLAVAARRRGLVLDADLRDDVPTGLRVEPGALRRADDALGTVLAALSPAARGGGVATVQAPRLTAGVERGDVVVRLVAAVDDDPPAPAGVLFDEDDGTGLWEVVLPSE